MALVGLDRETGLPLEGWDVVAQALGDATSTPQGTYPLARDYGIDIEGILDKPANAPFLLDALIATADALDTVVNLETGLPLVIFEGLGIEGLNADGQGLIRMSVVWTEDGDRRTVDLQPIGGSA